MLPGVPADVNSMGAYWCSYLVNASEAAPTTASLPVWPLLVAVWPCKTVGSTSSVGFLADRTIGRAYGTVCRLSVCLSVMFCIVAKRYVLAKKCLKE